MSQGINRSTLSPMAGHKRTLSRYLVGIALTGIGGGTTRDHQGFGNQFRAWSRLVSLLVASGLFQGFFSSFFSALAAFFDGAVVFLDCLEAPCFLVCFLLAFVVGAAPSDGFLAAFLAAFFSPFSAGFYCPKVILAGPRTSARPSKTLASFFIRDSPFPVGCPSSAASHATFHPGLTGAQP